MADETPEQIKAHRDQLKVENDTLNPQLDQMKASNVQLTESLRIANEVNATLKQQADQKSERVVELEKQIQRIREIAG